jgi:hypothetical protein
MNVVDDQQDSTGIKVRLFMPPKKPKTMKEAYPELAAVPEFEELDDNELRYVYYFACKDSPFYNDFPIRVKESKCFDTAFGKHREVEGRKAAFIGDMKDEHIVKAIIAMKMYSPTIRQRAQKMTNMMLDEYENMILAFKNRIWLSPDDAKPYVELTVKITSALPELVKQAEHGYGITERAKGNNASEEREEDGIFENAMNTIDPT